MKSKIINKEILPPWATRAENLSYSDRRTLAGFARVALRAWKTMVARARRMDRESENRKTVRVIFS